MILSSCKTGELDLVMCSDEGVVVFVEVKTRTLQSTHKYGPPEEAITFHKQRKIIKTAQYYLLENKYTDDIQWQIDVIAITINEEQNKAKINYIENAINHKDF